MFDKPSLIRIVAEDGQLIIDTSQKIQSRGSYLCKNYDCITKAQKRKAFNNLLHSNVSNEFFEELISYVQG